MARKRVRLPGLPGLPIHDDRVDLLVKVDKARCKPPPELAAFDKGWLSVSLLEIITRGAIHFSLLDPALAKGETKEDALVRQSWQRLANANPRASHVDKKSRLVLDKVRDPDEQGRITALVGEALAALSVEKLLRVPLAGLTRVAERHDLEYLSPKGTVRVEARARFNGNGRVQAIAEVDKKFAKSRNYARAFAVLSYPSNKDARTTPDIEVLDPEGAGSAPSYADQLRQILRHYQQYAARNGVTQLSDTYEQLLALPDDQLLARYAQGRSSALENGETPALSLAGDVVFRAGEGVYVGRVHSSFVKPPWMGSEAAEGHVFWGMWAGALELSLSSRIESLLDVDESGGPTRDNEGTLYVPFSDGTLFVWGRSLEHLRRSGMELPGAQPKGGDGSMTPSTNAFFDRPILNSPYDIPRWHWELDSQGQPTQNLVESRRRAEFITPIPRPRKRKGTGVQQLLVFDDLSTREQQYDATSIINQLRQYVDQWRQSPNPSDWRVTPETARLLQHWRHHSYSRVRPFFCQIEAVETAIWLTEVAPDYGKPGKALIEHLANANQDANPGLARLALKLATGAGKTTVMAMLIAWQTINAVRRPQSRRFTRGFLVVTPGLTIKDRLRVLQPNDPDSYYASRELVPVDFLDDMQRAKIVITNYHSFKPRERIELSKGGRAFLKGRGGELNTLENDGQMIQRVMPDLIGIKNILVLNDEAHHCYREKARAIDEDEDSDGPDLKGDERREAEKNNAAARLWITGLETVARKLGVNRVFDLSATPFFLRGSGYAEGTLFPWTMSDFSLMDAIECGIVKLPRVPVADNIPGEEMPMFRNLWEHIRVKMPKKGRDKASRLDPLSLPPQLQTALDALYGHYAKTFELWSNAGLRSPPCFIVVCNNTSTSKLVYDFISGFVRENEDGTRTPVAGRLPLFRNFDEHGNPHPRPNTLLIDSEQLESGEGFDENFREMASDEIERFRREIIERGGQQAIDLQEGREIDDVALLREVMNTVGKPGQLGGAIRCVVSVSMLTEGWDTNTVTHVLGVRAFGTQLLCEQVIGRALRRQSYELNEKGLFNVEYADVLGIPFDFTAKPVVAPPQEPRETVHVKAVRPDRDHLEILFPRVVGYRVEPPAERLSAEFNEDSVLELTPDLVGATETQNSGIIGERVNLSLVHTSDVRPSQVLYELVSHLVLTKWRDPGEDPKLYLFGQLKRIARQWLEGYLVCKGGTYPAQLRYKMLADMACERITAAITRSFGNQYPITATLDPYNPTGSTAQVSFNTSRTERWQPDSRRCHINWIVLDSDWEAEFCRVAEAHPRVRAYVKNHNLGLEVPYRYGSQMRLYRPDFIVLVDDGRGDADPLHLIVEIKGYRGEDAKEKRATMENYWVPSVNHTAKYGRWAFVEFAEVYQIEADFAAKVEKTFASMIERVVTQPSVGRD